jgi:signal recognition particle subunit SRP54
MKQMMDGLGSNMGMMGKIPGMKNLAMARNLKKQMAKGGGFPGMPGMGMPGMGGFPGMGGMPGLGGMGGMGGLMSGMGIPGFAPGGDGSMTKMKPLSTAEKNQKKAARKREKDARRKSRK